LDIFPAIDLKDGQVVRLSQGQMTRAKIYSSTPSILAKEFEDLGAKYLHIVDLNGAFLGKPANLEQIKEIRKNTKLKIQVGGGIRDEDTIKMYLDLGVSRLILGSIALQKPEFVEKMAKKYPLVLGIDALNGMVAVQGWEKVSKISAKDLAKRFCNIGLEAVICTDISKDGMLEGINLEFSEEIAKKSKLPTIASGGLKGLEDIKKCKESKNISGIIIGKAFYEGKIDLKQAFKLA